MGFLECLAVQKGIGYGELNPGAKRHDGGLVVLPVLCARFRSGRSL